MKNLWSIVLLLLFPHFAFADSWAPAVPQTVASPQGDFLLRTIPSKRLDDKGQKWSKGLFIVYQLDSVSQGYREKRRFNMDWHRGEFLINDLGDRIVAVGQDPKAVVVYDGRGKLLKTWALKDFYDNQAIKSLSETTSSVYWHGEVGWMSDQSGVWLSRPSRPTGKKVDFDDYLLDVRRLKISKHVPPKLTVE